MLANFCSAMQFCLISELITNSIKSQCGGCFLARRKLYKIYVQTSGDTCHQSRAKYSTQSSRSHSQTVLPSLCRICHFRFDNIIYTIYTTKKRAAPTLKSSQKNGEATGASNLVAHKAPQKNLYNLLLCKRYTNKHFGESPFLCVGLIFKSDNDWNQSGFGICHPNPILFWHFHFRKIELSSWQLEIILF